LKLHGDGNIKKKGGQMRGNDDVSQKERNEGGKRKVGMKGRV
jgi:hypothetical protein